MTTIWAFLSAYAGGAWSHPTSHNATGLPCIPAGLVVLLPLYLAVRDHNVRAANRLVTPPTPPPGPHLVVGADEVQVVCWPEHGPQRVVVRIHTVRLGDRELPWTAVREIGRKGKSLRFDLGSEGPLSVRPVTQEALDALHAAAVTALKRARALDPADEDAAAAVRRLGPPRR